MRNANLLLIILLCMFGQTCLAQQEEKDRVVKQNVYPQGFDNYTFGVFFYSGEDIFSVRGSKLFNGFPVVSMKVNPSSTTLAAIRRNKKGTTHVAIYSVNPRLPLRETPISAIRESKVQQTALAFSADAKQMAVAASNHLISIYEPLKMKLMTTLRTSLVPTILAYSDNGYFLGAAEGKTLEVWNMERGTVRTTLQTDYRINDFCFSNSSNNLLVLTSDGKLTVYDTKSFEPLYTIDSLGDAIACRPNSDGKYVAVVYNANNIVIVNLLDDSERRFVNDEKGSITNIRFVKNEFNGKNYLIYNNANSIVYHYTGELTPYYNKMMTTMLNERMNQWMKQLPGETMDEYNLRVNETTRVAQARIFETDIATKMATGLLEQSEVGIGEYDLATNSLALKFSTMPNTLFFLPVPMDELNDFTDAGKLEFRNAKYALNPDDKFELVYVEVYNPANGKTYVFDNMERRTLNRMSEGDNLVPLEIIQKSNMEETALLGIKEDIISLAKQENVISDKTHISVKTEAVNAVNADGEKIVNYNVGFTYEVEEEFSARDDFKPGRYHTEESAAAMLMLKIMQKAFETDFAKYIAKGKRVKIMVKGTADASPINRALPYDGRYGEFEGEPVYKNNELNNIILNKKDGIADNEQLAFARAIGVQSYIEKEITAFSDMNRTYEYHIEVASESGSQFRRISVQYTFIDAF